MSIKKATPKAVFAACEQLALLGHSWNRDDVRGIIGGGSFTVIDPLIQSWRKLQPVREVAPSVPAEVLIEVASLIEQKITHFVDEVSARDHAREQTLLQLNELSAAEFEQKEAELMISLEESQLTNHQLEAELSRVELDSMTEIAKEREHSQSLTLKLQITEEARSSLNKQLAEQKAFFESTLKDLKQEHKMALNDQASRSLELSNEQAQKLKLEYQQQLAQQKAELTGAAEITENRLMRLLDQSRLEIKEAHAEFNQKIDMLNRELQIEKQQCNSQKLEIKALQSAHEALTEESIKVEQDTEQQVITLRQELSLLSSENKAIKDQLLEYQTQGSQQAKSDLQQLKDSIRLLQEQVKIR